MASSKADPFGWVGQTIDGKFRVEEVVGEATIIATGGLASLISPVADSIEHEEPWLTLHGLRLIWEKNQP